MWFSCQELSLPSNLTLSCDFAATCYFSKLSAGNNFSLFTGHMSFQIFLLVGHLTNWTGHNLLTDNTLKKRTQDVLVRCSVIVSDHNVKLAGHFQNLVGQCPMTDCYFQRCKLTLILTLTQLSSKKLAVKSQQSSKSQLSHK